MNRSPAPRLLALLCLAAACGQSTTPTDAGTPAVEASMPADGGADAGRPLVPAGFERFCAGKDPGQLTKVTVDALGGKYLGAYKTGVDASGTQGPIVPGTLEMMKFVAPAPMWVDTIRVAFASGSGKARLRLENTFGRSYPASFPSVDPDQDPADFPHYDPAQDAIVPPVDLEVQGASPDKWFEVDVSAHGAVLWPTFNYMIIYQHLDAAPYLAIESVPPGGYSRATIFYPDQAGVYGVATDAMGTPGNFRLQITGHAFCPWSAADRWFSDTQPLGAMALGTSELADVNGDGHEDLVVTVPRSGDGAQPKVYLGDGKGGFQPAAFDALAAAKGAAMLAFADYDNDGDEDVFAALYLQPDGDGDGWVIQAGVPWAARYGDCNDRDPAIHPGVKEVQNGKDDNCDGVADEGTAGAADVSDSDGDGVTVKAGDCDDHDPTSHPGAPELLDGLDNDCSGRADDTFHHLLLWNTTAGCQQPGGNCPGGDGHFVVRPLSGLELSEDASALGVGDANGDGLLDLYWGSWLLHYPDAPAAASHFLVGNPACKQDPAQCGTFLDRMKADGMIIPTWKPVYGVTFNDFNNDGLQDIYVGNYQLNDNLMWQNLGGERFKNVAPALMIDHDGIPSPYPQYPGGHSYDSEFGDIDNDGDLDFFLCNLSHPRTQPWADPSQLYINQGPPGFGFVDRRHEMGIVYDEGTLNASFGDFDNDMDLDLALGVAYPGHYSIVYRNDGDHFTDVTYETGALVHQSGTVGWADVNEDGALDLKLHGSDSPQLHLFLNKIGLKNNWVEMTLQGTTTNRDGIGARVTLVAGGVSQMRDVRGSSGGGISADQDSRRVHFGLARNQAIDSVTVRWVGGKTERFTGLSPNGIYKVVEGSGKAVKVK